MIGNQLRRSPASRAGVDGGTTHFAAIASPSPHFAAINEGTAIMWFLTTNVSNTARFAIEREAGFAFNRRGADGTTLRFARYRATTDLAVVSSVGSVVANVWTYACATWDTADLARCRIYMGTEQERASDKTDVSTVLGAGTPLTATTQGMRLFSLANGNSGWPGRIAALAIVPRVLSPAECVELQWHTWRTVGAVGLWYPGSEGGGTRILDYSGNGNHAVITGTSLAAAAAVRMLPFTRRA